MKASSIVKIIFQNMDFAHEKIDKTATDFQRIKEVNNYCPSPCQPFLKTY